jgi:hypothetical protein
MAEEKKRDWYAKGKDGKKGDAKEKPMSRAEKQAGEREETHKRHQKARDDMHKNHQDEMEAMAKRHADEMMAESMPENNGVDATGATGAMPPAGAGAAAPAAAA